MMKQAFFVCATICILSLSAKAQLSFGVKAGVMLSNTVTLDRQDIDFVKVDPKLSYLAGGFVILPFTEKLSLQPELLYTNKGAGSLESQGISGESAHLHYLSVPVMLHYKIINGLGIAIGPEVSHLLAVGKGDRSLLEEVDIAINAGLSYAVHERWLVDLRYSLGVYDISEEFQWADPNDPLAFDPKTINRTLQLSVGWELGK